MIRRILYTVLFIMSFMTSQTLVAQKTMLDTTVVVVRGDIDLVENQFNSDSPVVRATAAPRIDSATFSVSITNGELIINYDIMDPLAKRKTSEGDFQYNIKDEQSNHNFKVDVTFKHDDEILFVSPVDMLGNLHNHVEGHGSKTIEVTGLSERYVQLEGELTVYLTLVTSYLLESAPICDNRPEYRFGRSVPYISAGVVGLGLIGGGIAVRKSADEDYDAYSRETDPNTTLLTDARDGLRTSRILMGVGAGILIADAVLFALDYRKYKKDLYMYRHYCDEGKIEIRPDIQMPSPYAQNGTIGLNIAYTFK